MTTAVRDPLAGRLLDGRYLVESRIAHGGMATVYLAVDRRLDREVAVKVMHAHLADDAQFRARFVREARSAARLSHPNVVQVFDQGEDDGLVYLTMELLRGRTLRTVLARRGVLTPRETLAVVGPVADALAAAHRAGIVHRDVKPENVVLTDEGRVKVADFGLARAASAGTATAGVLLGTVAYLAPELVARGIADARSDVYAVGVMSFEMLTGRQPFVGEVPIQVAYRHVHEDVPPPSDLVDGVPPALDELVLAATSRDPDGRPADGAHLLAAVEEVRGQLPPGGRDALGGLGDPVGDPTGHEAGAADSRGTEVVDVPGGHASQRPTRALPEHHLRDLRALRDRTDDDPDGGPGPVEGDDEGAGAGHPGASAVPELAGLAVRRRRRGLVALLVLLALALAVGTGGWWFAAGPGARVDVQDVTGLPADEAGRLLADQSLAVRTEQTFDDDVARGLVVGTEPAAGRPARRESTVVLFVSRGPELVAVPRVAGRSQRAATADLERAGFRVGEVGRAWHATVPEGRVVSSSPDQGRRVRSGQAVDLTVSRGPEPVEVPDLRGRGEQEARDLLARAGLTVGARTEEYDGADDPVPAGSVLRQVPAAGGTVARGSAVRIVVSQGPPLVAVPDVVGRQAAQARQLLRDQGLDADVDRFLGGLFGAVSSQEPAAGSLVPRGTSVRLTVV